MYNLKTYKTVRHFQGHTGPCMVSNVSNIKPLQTKADILKTSYENLMKISYLMRIIGKYRAKH